LEGKAWAFSQMLPGENSERSYARGFEVSAVRSSLYPGNKCLWATSLQDYSGEGSGKIGESVDEEIKEK